MLKRGKIIIIITIRGKDDEEWSSRVHVKEQGQFDFSKHFLNKNRVEKNNKTNRNVGTTDY